MSCSPRAAPEKKSRCSASPPTYSPTRPRRSSACSACSPISCSLHLSSPPSPDHTMNRRLRALARVIGGLSLTACASSGGANLSTVPPSPDPRVGLRAGAQAAWNLRLIVNRPASEKFVGVTNSDLAFFKNYVIQGNYNGFQVWDITNPAAPTLKVGYLCPASQSDVSVYQN